jgi:N-acetylmuramoyl-L-alanine amidase
MMPPKGSRRVAMKLLIAVALVAVAVIVVDGHRTSHPPASPPSRAASASVRTHPPAVDTMQPHQVDPALFSPDACMMYPPTHGDLHETVFLDAGHGGIDPGAVGYTENGTFITEAAVNLRIELDTMALLRAQGYQVVVSRTQQTTVVRLGPGDVSDDLLTVQGAHADVTARDICANMAKANILVGIYMDGGFPGAAGCLTAYDPDRRFSAQNLRLATLIQNDVLGAMNARGLDIPDAGVTSDSQLGSAVSAAALSYPHLLLLGPAQAGYFTTPSEMPGALIEPLYLTDPFEASVAASSSGQNLIAGGIAEAVGQYFEDSSGSSGGS